MTYVCKLYSRIIVDELNFLEKNQANRSKINEKLENYHFVLWWNNESRQNTLMLMEIG